MGDYSIIPSDSIKTDNKTIDLNVNKELEVKTSGIIDNTTIGLNENNELEITNPMKIYIDEGINFIVGDSTDKSNNNLSNWHLNTFTFNKSFKNIKFGLTTSSTFTTDTSSYAEIYKNGTRIETIPITFSSSGEKTQEHFHLLVFGM